MRKKPIRPSGLDRLPNPANLASRLRRIRNELHLMATACDDALERIENNDGEPQPRDA
jgi:hypothetical protein